MRAVRHGRSPRYGLRFFQGTPHFAPGIGRRGANVRRDWTQLFAAYRGKHPEVATEIDEMQRRELPAGWEHNLPSFPADPKGLAGREASGKVLNVLAQNIPWLLGGPRAVEQDGVDLRGRREISRRLVHYRASGHTKNPRPSEPQSQRRPSTSPSPYEAIRLTHDTTVVVSAILVCLDSF